MFGFLKDKLKKAIGAFTKSAETEVKEENVDDAKAIEQAKQEEKKILQKRAAPPKTTSKALPTKEMAAPKKESAKETPRKDSQKEPPKHESPAPKPAHTAQTKKDIPKETSKETPKERQKQERQKHEENNSPVASEPLKKEEKTVEESKPNRSAQHIPDEKKSTEKSPDTKETAKERPVPVAPAQVKRGFFGKLFGKKEEQREKPESTPHDKKTPITPVHETKTPQVVATNKQEEQKHEAPTRKEETEEKIAEQDTAEEDITKQDIAEDESPREERTGFLGKLKDAFTKKSLTAEKFDELFWELELAMLENNVAVEVIEKIKNDLRDELTSGKVSRMGIEDMITTRLRQSIEELFDVPTFDMVERIRAGPKPFKLCIIGVNGAGKTTTLAKIVHLLQKNDLSCVVAASDTFRAAAIDQLREHTDRLGVKLISQGYGADPAAVAFDAIKHAEAKAIDVVLIDTAGRLHSNTNLMQELEKVVRVSKPDMKLFVGEAITGNDCVEQATVFNKLVGIDAIILSKADIDEKGGAAISVSYVTGKPILYLGMGQTYDDLVPFDKEKIVDSLELE